MTTLERPIAPSAEELKAISDRFEKSEPHEILQWAVETYGAGLTMATAFGAEGCALLEMLGEKVPNGRSVHVFNLETGYQFKETLELRERIREKYGIEVAYVRPPESVAEMEARFGGPIYGTNPDECCHIRKVAPLKDALVGHTAWITAIRRDQTSHRAQADIVEWDPKFNLVKINPLANWSKKDVWSYITINEVPFNPLHDQGYPSIGCWPCTRAVSKDEDERSGRWSTSAKLECGLHTRK
jgi:phosphoadenosine phosphosulfate reductase